jgi:hypothetical protein
MSTGTAIATFDPRLKVDLKKYDIGGPRAFAIPGTISIGEGTLLLESVTWLNHTAGDAWLWMPNGDQFFDKPSQHDFTTPFRIPQEPAPEKERITFKVKMDPMKGRTQYQVYCPAIPGYADGNSPPYVSCP